MEDICSTGNCKDDTQPHKDFKIIADDGSVSVNRAFLSNQSDYFKEMFAGKNGPEQGSYKVVGYQIATVEQCIQFMRTGRVSLSENTVVDVLRLSHLWHITDAIHQCESFMITNLNPSNCVQYVNVAKSCDLERLEVIGLRHIDENVFDVEDIQDLNHGILCNLITKLGRSREKVTIIWNAVRTQINQRKEIDTNPCELIDGFPVELLSAKTFTSLVNDQHILSCESCQSTVTQRRNMHLAFDPGEIDVANCFKIKHLSSRYGAHHVNVLIDEFISLNFRKVCMQKNFMDVVTEEDLLTCIRGINRSCTVKEFDQILNWMNHAEGRHSIFPKLFHFAMSPQSVFQQSLRNLMNFINCDNCCFILRLCEIYSCETFEHDIDLFIQQNFSIIANSPSISDMSAQTLTRYASSRAIFQLEGGNCIWSAVIHWMNGRNNSDANEFPNIFDAMLLEEFDSYLLTDISKNVFVRNCNRCCSKLVEVTLRKFMQMRECLQENIGNVSSIETTVRDLRNEMQNQENARRTKQDHRVTFLQNMTSIMMCIIVVLMAVSVHLVYKSSSQQEAADILSIRLDSLTPKFDEFGEVISNILEDLKQSSLRIDNLLSQQEAIAILSLKLDNLTKRFEDVGKVFRDAYASSGSWSLFSIVELLKKVSCKFVYCYD